VISGRKVIFLEAISVTINDNAVQTNHHKWWWQNNCGSD